MNPDTYDIYRKWWADHYAHPCPISRTAFERYLRPERPPVQAPDTFDIDEERREGWYDPIR